jgi:alpha-D-ribose 1-methylphosphonate 5-triphosphate synthase subunit PhnL
MSKNEIVVYNPKREKMLVNLEKARAARGKLSTRIKRWNKSINSISKAATTGFLRSVPGICKLLKNAVPMMINGIASKVPNQKEQKQLRRIRISKKK